VNTLTITRLARNILMFGLVIVLLGLSSVVFSRLFEASRAGAAEEIWSNIGSSETLRAFVAYAALFALAKALYSGLRRAGLGAAAAAVVSLVVAANPIVVACAAALPVAWSIAGLAIAISPILTRSANAASSRSAVGDGGVFLVGALLVALFDAVALANVAGLRGGDATFVSLAAAVTRSLVSLLDYRHRTAIAIGGVVATFRHIAAAFALIGLLDEWGRQLAAAGVRRELAYLPFALILCDRSLAGTFSESPSLALELLLITVVFALTRRHADELSLGRMLATALALVAYWLISPNWLLLIPAFATALFFSVPETNGAVAPRIAAVTVAVFPLAAVQASASYIDHVYGLRLARLVGLWFGQSEIDISGADMEVVFVCSAMAVALAAGLLALRGDGRMRGAVDAAGRSLAAAMPAILVAALSLFHRSSETAPYLISFACLSGLLVLVIAREVASARLVPSYRPQATAA